MQYAKMHGCGNSFYVVDARQDGHGDQDVLAVAMQNCGGCLDVDGVVVVHPSMIAHVKTVIYNADGSKAPMCGNGVRCLSKYVVDRAPECAESILSSVSFGDLVRHLATANNSLPPEVCRVLLRSILQVDWAVSDRVALFRLTAETDSGIRTHFCLSRNGSVEWVTVDMGRAELRLSELNCTLDGEEACDRCVSVGERSYPMTVVGLGNLHCVTFVDDVDQIDREKDGRSIESCTQVFPDSVNVHFVQVLAKDHILIRTWERGSGATLACGTGSCASVVAGVRSGRCLPGCRVDQPGGTIHVGVGESILMSGPVVEVRQGSWPEVDPLCGQQQESR